MSEGFFAPLLFPWMILFRLFFQVATKEVVLQQMLESLPQSLVTWLGGGNSNISYFHYYLRKLPILTIIFFEMGWNHQSVGVFSLYQQLGATFSTLDNLKDSLS